MTDNQHTGSKADCTGHPTTIGFRATWMNTTFRCSTRGVATKHDCRLQQSTNFYLQSIHDSVTKVGIITFPKLVRSASIIWQRSKRKLKNSWNNADGKGSWRVWQTGLTGSGRCGAYHGQLK